MWYRTEPSDNLSVIVPDGYSCEISVQNPPRDAPPRPKVCHRFEDGLEISPFCRGKKSGHILADDPLWVNFFGSSKELKGQVSSRVSQSSTVSGQAVRLARETAGHKTNCSTILAPIDLCEVAEVRHVGIFD